MDRLEEFIRNNRDGLDKLNPSPGVWNTIRKRINKRRNILFSRIAAAAVLVIIAYSSFLLLRNPGRTGSPEITGKVYPKDQQLRELELYYNSIIGSLYTEADPLFTGNPELKQELTDDISHLDSIFYDIKKDLKDNASNQEVISALIQNYRIRIRILEDMLEILREDENNPDKTNGHEL